MHTPYPAPRHQQTYGLLPSVTIPGTKKTLSGDSVAGLLLLLGVGYGVYRFARANT
jgi:hypothetical protein